MRLCRATPRQNGCLRQPLILLFAPGQQQSQFLPTLLMAENDKSLGSGGWPPASLTADPSSSLAVFQYLQYAETLSPV